MKLTLRLALLVLAGFVAALEMDIEHEMAAEFALYPRAGETNLQTFTAALGGATAPPITNSGDASRPYEVEGDTFPDFPTAGDRSCSDQHNDCANLANAGGQDFEVGDCDTQQSSCEAAIASATQTAFSVLVSSDANFDYFCDE